ncbi:MAG: DUF1501 domain-containing protein [Acidobacteria bacterium]|nr:DUF1501 domain-containing protein [Acidobacteriota bacterium]
MFSRRLLLKSSALAMFAEGAAPGWLARAAGLSDGQPSRRRKVLVAIFQRGAVDGLNMVVPYGEADYYALRPGIAIPRPAGDGESAIDLDGFFGLHPSLAPLKPIFADRRLAIVHAAGSPDPTRSHFDAQDYMESGTPGRKSTADGWLNRALPDSKASPVQAVNIGANLARSLRGPHNAIAMSSLADFQVRDVRSASSFEAMYGADPLMAAPARETFEALRVIEAVRRSPYAPANQAVYPSSRFGQSMEQIARLIKADCGLEVAFTELGGWDTHVNEVGAKPSAGQLANLLADFGQALAAFHSDMGDRMSDVAVVTMSEFGRTARENGNRGTDHGHGNAMFVMGGQVRGGKVYGEWPGLTPAKLYEGRDLAVTTDFRDVLGELTVRHLGASSPDRVFPDHRQRFCNLIA